MKSRCRKIASKAKPRTEALSWSDRNPAYGEAIRKPKAGNILDHSVDHRQVKYLNNRLEADHGAIKRRIRSMLGFKSAKAAYATLKGIEAMRICCINDHAARTLLQIASSVRPKVCGTRY